LRIAPAHTKKKKRKKKKKKGKKIKGQSNSELPMYPRYPSRSLWVHKQCYICPLLSLFWIQISPSLFQSLTPLSFHTPEIVALGLPWVLKIPASKAQFQHQKLLGVERCKPVSNDRGLHWHSCMDAKALLRRE